MPGLHDVDGVAVRGEVAAEAERFPGQFLGQLHVGRRRDAVDLVVRAHDRARVALGDDLGELLGVVLAQRPLVHVGAAGQPAVLGVVGREVLERGQSLVVAVRRRRQLTLRGLALQAVHVLRGQVGGEDRVLAPGLVVAAPARVAGQVHGRGVEVQVLGVARRHLTGLGPDLAGLVVDQVRVPGAAHGQVRRIRRGVGQGGGVTARGQGGRVHAVIGLVPPAPGGHAQARDRGGPAAVHLRGLLGRGHPGDQVSGALRRAVGPVQVDGHGLGLGAGGRVAGSAMGGRVASSAAGTATATEAAIAAYLNARVDRGSKFPKLIRPLFGQAPSLMPRSASGPQTSARSSRPGPRYHQPRSKIPRKSTIEYSKCFDSPIVGRRVEAHGWRCQRSALAGPRAGRAGWWQGGGWPAGAAVGGQLVTSALVRRAQASEPASTR